MPELTETQLMLVVVAVVVLAVLAVFVSIQIGRVRRRRMDLRSRFGAEYDRSLEQADSRREAEEELLDRVDRHRQVSLAALSHEEAEGYRHRLEGLQAAFVTSPVAAVRMVDALVTEVAVARGYPDGAPGRILSDVSVDHPDEVAAHRRGQSLLHEADAEHQPDTERLRCALVASGHLIEALLGDRAQIATLGGRPTDAATDGSRVGSATPTAEPDGSGPPAREGELAPRREPVPVETPPAP